MARRGGTGAKTFEALPACLHSASEVNIALGLLLELAQISVIFICDKSLHYFVFFCRQLESWHPDRSRYRVQRKISPHAAAFCFTYGFLPSFLSLRRQLLKGTKADTMHFYADISSPLVPRKKTAYCVHSDLSPPGLAVGQINPLCRPPIAPSALHAPAPFPPSFHEKGCPKNTFTSLARFRNAFNDGHLFWPAANALTSSMAS